MAEARWSRAFVSTLEPEAKGVATAMPDLELRLAGWIEQARAAWPAVEHDGETFLRHVAKKLPTGKAMAPAFATLCIEDLYLASACGDHVPAAIDGFHQLCSDIIREAIQSVDGAREFADDVDQDLQLRLLVQDTSGHALILDYAGKSPLRSWVRQVALHAAFKVARRARKQAPLDEDFAGRVVAHEDEPWVVVAKQTYAQAFEGAFRHGLQRLSPRERNLLRQTSLDHLTIDHLAGLYGVHRATAARWAAAARSKLFELIRQALAHDLKVDPNELDSMLRVVRSQLHVSVHRYFTMST